MTTTYKLTNSLLSEDCKDDRIGKRGNKGRRECYKKSIVYGKFYLYRQSLGLHGPASSQVGIAIVCFGVG